MKIVKQSWKYLFKPKGDKLLKWIELSGRTCYKSEDKITHDSAAAFVRKILKSGHHSVIEHPVISIKAITDRGVTHEIVRHRIASYSQESTRYCNYGKLGVKFIEPVDFKLDKADKAILKSLEDHYNACIAKGRSPQQARYFLPNGLKTEIVITYNLREWRHFFTLRTVSGAHPQMIALANSILRQFKKDFPVIFEDL